MLRNRWVLSLLVIGLVGVAGMHISSYGAEQPVMEQPGQPVVLISLDTFRDDRLSIEGYKRNITPHLDTFMQDAYYFKNAYANAPWTLPSHSAVFTGKLPSETGTYGFQWRICESVPTIADKLSRRGYKTVSFNGDGAIHASFGFSQGFDIYNQTLPTLWGGIQRRASRWVAQNRDQQFFLFLHGYDVHRPYVVPDSEPLRYGQKKESFIETEEELEAAKRRENASRASTVYEPLLRNVSATERQHIVDMYDNGVYYMDRSIGRFFDTLKRVGVYDDALIILFSDHGESLGEYGRFDHNSLREPVIRAPIAVKFPEQHRGKTVSDLVALRDIYPTVLSFVGEDDAGPAIPLQSIIRGEENHERVFIEHWPALGVINNSHKLIWKKLPEKANLRGADTDQYELYDLRSEGPRRHDLSNRSRLLESLNRSFQGFPSRNQSRYCPSGVGISEDKVELP